MNPREICKVTDPVGPGEHKHRCVPCDLIWKHHGFLLMLGPEEIFDLAHTCPVCSANITEKFNEASQKR